MNWSYLTNVDDIAKFLNLYNNFLDSEIISILFESGNFIDRDLVGHEFMKNSLSVVFQRMDTNPFSIEMLFEEMRKINFYAPLVDECSASIDFAKVVKAGEFIYWTKWKNFDPNNIDHLKADVTYIQARKIRWRIIS